MLRLIAVGHSNKEVAAQLKISVKTVEVHKANAMRKLGLTGRVDIIRYGVLQGWLLRHLGKTRTAYRFSQLWSDAPGCSTLGSEGGTSPSTEEPMNSVRSFRIDS